MTGPPTIPLTYILNHLFDQDPDNDSFPLDLNPSVLKQNRVILAYHDEIKRDAAIPYIALLKAIQTNSNVYILVNSNKKADQIKSVINELIPDIAAINRFEHPDLREIPYPRIYISTYQRFLNQILEHKVKGIKVVILYNFNWIIKRNYHVKELLLSQLLNYKETIRPYKGNSNNRNIHIIWVWETLPQSQEPTLRQLKLLKNNQEYTREIENRFVRTHILWKDFHVHDDGIDSNIFFIEEQESFDYFILGSCYRRAIKKNNIISLINQSQYGVLCTMGKNPPFFDLARVIEERLQALIQAGLIVVKNEFYYKTTEMGQGLVRYGLNLYDHEEVISIIADHKVFITKNLNELRKFFSSEIEFKGRKEESFEKLYQDLVACSQSIDKPLYYLKYFFNNLYLRILFREPEYRKNKEEIEEKKIIKEYTAAIMGYIQRKPNPKMASFKELSNILKYTTKYLEICLNILEKNGQIIRKKQVVLHRKVKVWGNSFSRNKCKECYFFTTDHLCSFWINIKRNNESLVPNYLLERTDENYNPEAHGCHVFHQKPENFRIHKIEKNKLLEKLKFSLDSLEPILLPVTFFSKYSICPTDAILTLLGFNLYNIDMRKGIERHRIFQRFNQELIKEFKKNSQIETSGLYELLSYMKYKCSVMKFEQLNNQEIEIFLDTYIQYIIDKISLNRKDLYSKEEILRIIFGGIPRIEEEVRGSTIKGRGDLIIYSKDVINIIDLKPSGPYYYQKLQLAALAIAIEERARERNERINIGKLIILTQNMKEHQFELTDKLRNQIQEIKNELENFNVNKIKTGEKCNNLLCDKRNICTIENLQEFKLNRHYGFKCFICKDRFESLEYRGIFPTRTLIQCQTCRTTYKHDEILIGDNQKKELITITPDLDHILVKKARKLGVELGITSVYRRKSVKILYPDTEFDESKLLEGIFPVLEDGVYPKLTEIGVIKDKKSGISEEMQIFLKTKYNINVYQDQQPIKYNKIEPFYDEIFNIVRKTEGFPKKLTLSNIESRYTFVRLALILCENDDKLAEINSWIILDIYLHALLTSDLRALRALEGSAASRMWAFIKPFFKEKELEVNSRLLERRVLDQYLFSSIKTAAKSKGNVLINYFFHKCGEFTRLLHNQLLLGWYGTSGLNHGRLRKTSLDEMGLVVDLNENFKLIFLLGLIKALKDNKIKKWHVKAWIGTRRMYNYYLDRKIMEIIENNCEDLWINGYLKELQIEKKNLKTNYEEFLLNLKNQSIILYINLLTIPIEGISILNHLKDFNKNGEKAFPVIKDVCIKIVSKMFHPFSLKSSKIIMPQNEKWRYFKIWKKIFLN